MNISDDLKKRVFDAIENKENDIILLAQELIKRNTVTDPPSGNEKEGQDVVIKYLENIVDDLDVFEPTQVDGLKDHEGYYPGWDYKNRPNVVGVCKGKDNSKGNSIILNGHIDVVSPGNLEYWDYDPFSGEIDNDRIYGRGSSDMKGPIAGIIMALHILKDLNIELNGDVIVESVVNEELGGYNGTLSCILKGYEADLAIVAEPTQLRICPGQKGGLVYKIKTVGEGAHIARWWKGKSSLELAFMVKKLLSRYQLKREKETKNNTLFGDKELFPISAFVDDIYYLKAGDKNIMGTPSETEMELWFDVLPGENLSDKMKEFENYLEKETELNSNFGPNSLKIERGEMREFYPTFMNLKHPGLKELKKSYIRVNNDDPIICGFESACEGMMFNKWSNTPAVIFGPGNIELAHRANEYIEINELKEFIKILTIMLLSWCGFEKDD
jgi:acetylornithine deacetylase